MSESTIEPPISILRRPQVEARTGLSRSTIYERMKQGTFPSPISLGTKAVGWLEHEIDDWLGQRIKASRACGPRFNIRN
jgi:prophage regulatory protein